MTMPRYLVRIEYRTKGGAPRIYADMIQAESLKEASAQAMRIVKHDRKGTEPIDMVARPALAGERL